MKKWIIVSLVMAAFSSCVPAEEEKIETCDELCNPDTQEKPALKGIVLSGHLGNNIDCPSPVGNVDSDVAAGACEEGAENCGGPLNCEDGALSLTIENRGAADGVGLVLQNLELLDADGNLVGDLMQTSLEESDLDGGGARQFDGIVEEDERIRLDIDFAEVITATTDEGVGDAAFPQSGSGKFIRITFSADNHNDVTVTSMELFQLPSVDT